MLKISLIVTGMLWLAFNGYSQPPGLPVQITWEVCPAEEADANGQGSWVPAEVPGTVFGAYVAAGLEKDPNFGDNAYNVDKRKYDRDYWYRGRFNGFDVLPGQRIWLNFEGINRKGDIYFNGRKIGFLDGFMDRGRFDVTDLLSDDGQNVIGVLVHWVGKPVPNHRSPTYIASAGWDWMPYVPGLLSGITDDVYLTTTRDVSIIDPWIRTKVPSRDRAEVSLQVELENSGNQTAKTVLSGVIRPGNIAFSREVELKAGERQTVRLDPQHVRELAIENPLLWWPNGYGEPHLYTCELAARVDGTVSDTRTVTFGIREYGYDFVDGVFRLSVNGEPVYVKGGNWGMSEWMLRCRGAEYDHKLRLHNEMNYNMIRNWIGSVTDEEFYDACDRYGIMVWDDFWLNSHPNLPDDVQAFQHNAIEKIKRLRNHPCIAVWCGDNEGYPLAPLNDWLAGNVKYYDGGDRWYQPISNNEGLSGSGPWANFHPSWYFSEYPMMYGFKGKPGWGFRTEIGTAVFTTFESFRKFMPEESWWPRNEMWDKHFFGPQAANASPDKYFETVGRNYGEPSGIEDFCRKAQLLNIEVNKAMYEGWQHNIWNDATGILTWMSQSAYPSLVWQTYDYYHDLTGAYWGVKKACEPVHIQWSYGDNSVKVVNTTLRDLKDVTAKATVYNLDGRELPGYGQIASGHAPANDASFFFHMNFVRGNLAYKKPVFASSVSNDARGPEAIVDGSDGSRWASEYSDDQWICIDLEEEQPVANITIKWEDAHARAYRIQVSGDAKQWTDVYANDDSRGGNEEISFDPVSARYVRMLGVKRATQWGYSLYEMEVYGPQRPTQELSPVHFIRLELTDADGGLLSDNFYWRSTVMGDYTALNDMKPARVKVTSELGTRGDRNIIKATVRNTGQAVAFAVHLQAYRNSDGERILPAVMDDNYFTLMPRESRQVEIEFDPALLPDGRYTLKATPYNL